MKEPKKAVSVLLPLPLYETLSQMAKDSYRTLPGYIRQIIKHYLQYLDHEQCQEDDWHPPAI